MLCVALGYALVAMPLGMVGALRPVPALLLTVVATAGLLWLARGVRLPALPAWPAGAAARAGVGAAGVALLAVASAAVNAHFASEHVLMDRDPGIYLMLGRWLADHGSLLLGNPRHFNSPDGGFIAQCPATCGGAPGDRLYVQFLHLLPATLAAGAWLGGVALMVKVNAILGGLSLLAFYAFATRIMRPLIALGATLALALNFAQVYFARDSYSEILAQLFLFGGLFMLWDGRARWDARRGLLAGLLLGATCMARIDSFVYLIPLACYVVGELVLAEARERRRFARFVGVGVAVTAAFGAVDLYRFSRGYYRLEASELHAVEAGLVLTLVLGSVTLVVARLRPRLRSAALRLPSRAATAAALAVAAAGLFAYLVRPHLGPATDGRNGALVYLQGAQGLPIQPRRTYAEQTMVWLGWYLGPVAVVAGIAGMALAVRDVLSGRRPGLAPFAGIALAITTLYVTRPSIFPNQVWAMRRFLPVTIPALILLGAWAAQRLGDWLAVRRPPARTIVPALVIAAAVAVPVWDLRGFFQMREQEGGLRAMSAVCDRLPSRAVVWTLSDRESGLLQPVHTFCGVPVAQAPEYVKRNYVRRYARQFGREGRPLYLLASRRRPIAHLVRPPSRLGHPVIFRYHKLEESLDHRPRHLLPRRAVLYIARP
jgi:hypothetical protein